MVMFEKNLELGLLLDFYGAILPERRKDVMDLYYNDDLSLSEIAEQVGVTRQAVRETIKKTETELFFYEEKLGLLRRSAEIQQCAERIRTLCESESVCSVLPVETKAALDWELEQLCRTIEDEP